MTRKEDRTHAKRAAGRSRKVSIADEGRSEGDEKAEGPEEKRAVDVDEGVNRHADRGSTKEAGEEEQGCSASHCDDGMQMTGAVHSGGKIRRDDRANGSFWTFRSAMSHYTPSS